VIKQSGNEEADQETRGQAGEEDVAMYCCIYEQTVRGREARPWMAATRRAAAAAVV